MLDVEFIDYILFRSENYNLSIQNYEYCIVIRLYDIVDTAIKIHNKCCLRW
jgi:hypothetical protein|nr:MAG TPA: hypothetical protein [Caudoviricetes sp.]